MNSPGAPATRTSAGRRALAQAARLIVIAGLGLAVLAGCEPAAAPAHDVEVEIQVDPDPPRIGPLAIRLRMRDRDGRPVRGAAVRIEATMTHPGMTPSIGRVTEAAPGLYGVSLPITMRGDWVVIAEARLPDGRRLERTFPLRGVRE